MRSKVLGAVLTAALVAMCGPAAAATPSFTPYDVYGLGANVLSAAVADVTGDGRPDVVVTTGYGENPANAYKLVVLPQTASGTLGPAVRYDTLAERYDWLGVATGDLNGDGRMDVAVATSHGIEMHYGRVGSLGPAEYVNNTPAERVVITQLDGGGAPEMVSWGEGGIHILRKDATWSIWWSEQLTTMDPTDVEVGDVTGDGRPDVIGVLTTFSVFPQLPDGRFGVPVEYVANSASTGRGAELALGDMNGDGRNDVVQSIPSTSLGADLYVFLQTPTGTLAGPTPYSSNGATDSIEIADLDRDGRSDLVGVHRSTGQVGVWYRGMELGEEVHDIAVPTWSMSDRLALGDVSGDGRPDLVIADPTNGLVVVRSVPDTDPPETTLTGWPGGPSTDGTATFSFAANEASTFTCSLNGSYGPCRSPQSYAGLADADYSFTVVATDLAGNVDPSPAVRTFTVEARAPETTITGGPSGAIASTGATFSFAADEVVDHFECSFGGAPFASCPSPQAYTGLTDGAYEFQVRAVDRVLNRDGTPAARSFTVDTRAPQTTITDGPSGTITSDTATFSFVADEQVASFECSFQGAAFTSCPSPMTYADLVDGTYEFQVRAADPLLNWDATPAVRTFAVARASAVVMPTALSVNDVAVAERNSGTAAATFTVTRSGDASGTSTVKYRTSGGTATPDTDYTAVAMTSLSFAAGETSKTITVNVAGDSLPEDDETFDVVLSAPTGAVISDTTGTATILNDDGAAYLSVGDISVLEGNSGTTPAVFTVTRSGNTNGTSSVSYATKTGTAGAADFSAVALTTATFAPGETSKTVTVAVTGDTTVEANEGFTLVLSGAVGATIADASGTATIVDDEGAVVPGPATFLGIDDISVAEGNSGATAATFTVTRSGSTAAASTVKYKTSVGTATAGTDYTAVATTSLSFAPGETSKTVTVTVTGDTLPEDDETFNVVLSAATGAVISDASGTATIVNDDGSAYLAVNDVSMIEGNAGTTVTFTVTRSGNTTGASTVKYATKAGTAGPNDFTAVPLTVLDFAAGETTKTVVVSVTGDTTHEGNEKFTLVLSAATGATISDAAGTATIVDDD